MNTAPLLHTVREASEILRVTDRTIRNWIARRDLRAIRVGDHGPWRIPDSEITRLMRRR